MSFKDIKGQDRTVSVLKGTLEADRVAHAYIFFGPSGVGKKLTALNFAKALNCLTDASDRPCDACVSCRKIDGRNHPDVHVLEPEKEGASIKIDEIRQVIKDINMKPSEAGKKVYIIDEAHEMTDEASNAILKTLEEPPSESILILITEKMTGLLPTIQSRAQALKFFPLGIEMIREILAAKHNIDGAKAELLARLASGSVGMAVRNSDEDFFEKRSMITKILANNSDISSYLESVPRSELKESLDIMLTWYRDMLLAKIGAGDDVALINADSKKVLTEEASAVSLDVILNTIRNIVDTNSSLDLNVNAKLAIGLLEARTMKNVGV